MILLIKFPDGKVLCRGLRSGIYNKQLAISVSAHYALSYIVSYLAIRVVSERQIGLPVRLAMEWRAQREKRLTETQSNEPAGNTRLRPSCLHRPFALYHARHLHVQWLM